ncbi:S24 family peptidase [Halomonas sp. SpR1]|uniref:XRE family transcriptional regulator n=1 Tax=Halomonas sp. SpR1 TaxID=3050462 RepID=UPI0027E3E23C|nr:S24 family peptidase [Halomonas sp. SpR1]MDQ7735779.1 S24 family peptidase [Halomonas sp. SpR1]
MSSIGMRLREERVRLGFSQTELGDIAGITKNTQMLYESEKRSPKADYLSALHAVGVNTHYVLTGNRSISSSGESLSLAANEPGPDLSPVKMYDIEAAAGAGRSFEGEPVKTTLYFSTVELSEQGLDPAQVVGIKVRGDSMDGTLADGDWVLVDRSNRDPKQEGVFLLLVSGERRIKRVQRLAGGALYLISDNDHYQPEMIKPQDMHDVEILGRCEIRIGRVV